MKRFGSLLLQVLAFAGGMALAFYVLGVEMGILYSAVAGLFALQLRQERRHRQWLLPILALAWTLVALFVVYKLRGSYQQLLQTYAQQRTWIENLLGIVIPSDIADALLLLNGVLLSAFVILKLIVIAVLRTTDRVQPATEYPTFPIAYLFRPEIGWVLRPWWRHARWLSWAFAGLGVVATAICWAALQGYVSIPWLPLLPMAIFLVGLEIASWLGGRLDETWQPEFEGDDTPPVTTGQFNMLWARYRRKWAGQWLIAGNRLPAADDGAETG